MTFCHFLDAVILSINFPKLIQVQREHARLMTRETKSLINIKDQLQKRQKATHRNPWELREKKQQLEKV